MKAAIKKALKSCIRFAVNGVMKSAIGGYSVDQVLDIALSRTKTVQHQGVALTFAVPNKLNLFRVDSFSIKEPETLEWIDGIPQGAVLWDIGANIGLYTCYAAKARGCRVVAFEPSIFNLELLARNISLNSLTSTATIIPLPLTDALTISTLNMTTTEWGGAMSTFDQSYTHDGSMLKKVFEFRTIGLSMDEALALLRTAQPDYIKMDVDGIEHLILKGGTEVLKNIKSVLIEINDDFEEQAVNSVRYLREAGLVVKAKRHANMFDHSPYKNSFNQIWHRATM